MGNKQSVTAEDVAAMEASSKHLNEHKDPAVKSMRKKLQAIMDQVTSGGPPDFKKLFDELAVDGKIDKTNFTILLRGAFNLAVKTVLTQVKEPAGEFMVCVVGPQASVTGLAVALKAANRLDLHSTKLMERVFAFLDKDNSGFLEFEEIESFIKDVMTNPQSVIDPFRFIGGSGSDKITVADVVNLCDEVFEFYADYMIQMVDLFEEVFTSHDVLHAIELDEPLWKSMFSAVGADGAIPKKAVTELAETDFWEQVNGQFSEGINNPAMKATMDLNKKQMKQQFDTICAGISETGSAEEGLARAWAWLKNGVDETTFMSTMVPSVRKMIEEKCKPEAIAKEVREAFAAGVATQANNPDPQGQMIAGMIAAQLGQPGFLEGIFSKPACVELIQKYGAAYQEKAPIMLHHCFRFCDINSDGGVSESELKVLFALKDSIAQGKLNEALLHIFDVLDEDGNGQLSPKEILAFFSKVAHFMCATMRIGISMYMEILLPGIVKIALPEICQLVGITEITKEQLPELIMMGQMQMGAVNNMLGKGQGKGY